MSEFVEAAVMEDMFGRWSAAMMRADGTGRQSKSFNSETDLIKALKKHYPDVKVTYDG